MSMTVMKIYKLYTDADNGLVLRTDLEYFQTHFVGKPMRLSWEAPNLSILNKSKPLRDFTSWTLQALVISEKAKICLDPLIGRYVEFLPLVQIKTKQLYAINVLNILNCLNVERSSILHSPTNPDRIMSVHRFAFDEEKFLLDPIIFKVPEDLGCVFVSGTFVEAVIKNRLKGSLLLNPGANPFANILPNSPEVFKPV